MRALAPHAKLAARLALAIGVAALLWLGAFLRFAGDLPRQVADPAQPTDGIVVFTGGAVRLDVGLDLLAQGKAKRLFISGVNPATTRSAMQAVAGRAELFECCVDLGFAAADTVGNAIETAVWADAAGYRSLRVVTAGYHMPRSLVELRRRLPGVALVAHPVFPEHVKLDRWWSWPGTAGLLVQEFHKYVFALARARIEALALRAIRRV